MLPYRHTAGPDQVKVVQQSFEGSGFPIDFKYAQKSKLPPAASGIGLRFTYPVSGADFLIHAMFTGILLFGADSFETRGEMRENFMSIRLSKARVLKEDHNECRPDLGARQCREMRAGEFGPHQEGTWTREWTRESFPLP